ncbi:low specificity L-threonine aldolase [Tumebacillus avium]|uniref:Low specificity L-threonine aldolase n=1 Tax=Tumebacillus avium TaxID=1903704 RepID=A0A1Y0IJR0_9BACL|nr:aminotransferase class I/II-fold pyridoxal phosphate-dependent enzyme [Tumebacillus avium]ARU60761.1 low specificity L-threonine aldolase [Tumebacillus avium]
MSGHNVVAEAFAQTQYQVGGHGKRIVQVLKDVLNEVEGTVEGDMYGSGKLIADFEAKMAEYLGKESAVFFPSGTMAQQIALRIWCDELGLKKVAYHPLSHLEIHEEAGLRELHGIESVLLGEKDRLIQLEEILNLQEEIACLLLELPQREIGGQLPSFEDLQKISAHCREKGIRLHLDGARLFEILPYYQKTAQEVCALFDSVYVSFYKGIGGIAGAILAGSAEFTKQSKVWKRRHGGDLISLYPYILTADAYFDQRIPKMGQYYEQAQELAGLYNQCPRVTTWPEVPVSNMFHVHVELPKAELEPILAAVYAETGVGLTPYVREYDESTSSFEVGIGDRYAQVPKDALHTAFRLLHEKLQNL